MFRFLFIIFFFIGIQNVQAQKAVHWAQYIRLSPGFMGPNALPVPEVKRGMVTNQVETTIAFESHINPGDMTQNLFFEAVVPLAKDLVSVVASMVPVEFWKMNQEIMDERLTRDVDGQDVSVGDLYLGTDFRVIRNRNKLPDITLSMRFKIPSGSDLDDARFTDAGGYFLNAGFGKSFSGNERKAETRLYGHLGFYVWQTSDFFHRQNDAFAFGLGAESTWEKFEVSNEFSGYAGYFGNRDRPLVYRLKLSARPGRFEPHIRYQFSHNTIMYHTIRVGCSYVFERSFKLLNRKRDTNL